MVLRWLEDLAVQHKKKKLGENAWQYVQALVAEDFNAAYELLAIPDYYWKEINVLQSHVEIIRASIGDDEAHALAEAEIYALAEAEAYALSLAEAQAEQAEAEQAQTAIEAVEVTGEPAA